MHKLFLIAICCLFMAGTGYSQSSPKAPKPVVKKPVPVAVATEISAAEWNLIITSMDSEDWDKAARLIQGSFSKLKTDNEKKQLAQLRYFYLYALAGRVAAGKLAQEQLEVFANGLIDVEFLFPARKILADCTNSLNAICPSKDKNHVLRVTATNKSATVIHSFEYTEFSEDFNIKANSGKTAFISGYLKKIELNLNKSNIWIMRLYFDGGIIRLVQ